MDNIEKAVVILGAGASAPFGVPTLRKVFQDSEAIAYLKANVALHDQLQSVFWAPRGHTLKTSHETLTVEEMLTLIRDYEKNEYDAPPLHIDDPLKFRKDLYCLIKRAVYDEKSSQSAHLNPIISLARNRFESTTWASFNWDCMFESSFYYSSGPPQPLSRHNPHLVVNIENWRDGPLNHTFLKLHGGVNWWFTDKLRYLTFGANPELNNRWRDYEEGTTEGHPVILEPSYYKYSDPVYDLLKIQWHAFVRALVEAQLVVIIGYSLPEADLESRRALTIGFQSNEVARFVVIDDQKWVCERYQRLLGNTRVTCVQKPLQEINADLDAILLGAQ